jgi:hypothetical protein
MATYFVACGYVRASVVTRSRVWSNSARAAFGWGLGFGIYTVITQ